MSLRLVHVAAFAVVMVGWLVFAGIFLFRKKPPREKATRQEPLSMVGIALQGLAYAAIWMLERPRFTPIVPLPGLLEVVPPVAAALLSVFSVRLSLVAI